MTKPIPKITEGHLKLDVILTTMLSALAIPIHIAKIDFPLAPFLKFDLCGIPLTVAGFVNLPLSILLGLPIFYLGILLIGATNPLSPLMKVVAEASTYIPMVYLYRYLRLHYHSVAKFSSLLLIAIAIASRSIVMVILNILVTPLIATLFWGAPSYTVALNTIVIPILHIITLFNAISAAYISTLSIPIIRMLNRIGIAVKQ